MYASTEQRNRERVQVLADQLYRERYHYLVRIARRNGAGDDAPDAVNDSFTAFIDKFDLDCGAPPLAWVTLTLKRRCWAITGSRRLDRRAGHWVHPESGEPRFSVANLPTQTAGPEESAERAEYVLGARERLAALKPDERMALLLFGLGYSYHEIGEQRDWSYTKVNRCIAEGRAALRTAGAAAS